MEPGNDFSGSGNLPSVNDGASSAGVLVKNDMIKSTHVRITLYFSIQQHYIKVIPPIRRFCSRRLPLTSTPTRKKGKFATLQIVQEKRFVNYGFNYGPKSNFIVSNYQFFIPLEVCKTILI